MPALMSGQVSVEKLAEMMKPKKVEGKWRKPELSRRIVAKVRKAWLTDGREWPFEKPRTNYGGWAIEDLPKVKQKGKKVDRLAADRQKHIEERMKVMPQLIEEYREKYRAWRRCDGMSPVDKTFMTPKQLRKKQKAQQN
jgi:hypothetical protein